MNDMQILENLFNNKHDEITFQNLQESNIISLNNNNKGEFSKQKLLFNTLQVSKKRLIILSHILYLKSKLLFLL